MGFDDPFDLDKAPIMLPKYSAIIFDEAHELPSIGREHLSHSIGSHDIKRLKEDLAKLQMLIDRSELEIAQDAPCCDFAEVNSKFRKALVD